MSTPAISTFIDLLQVRTNQDRDGIAYTFLEDGDNETATLSYGELDRRARVIAARLEQLAQVGDRAIMLYDSGVEPAYAFIGCIYAGVVPVPAFPILPNRPPATFVAMQQDAGAKFVLTTRAVHARTLPLLANIPELADLQWIETDHLDPGLADEWHTPDISPDLPTLILYTSGSTSAPKGVLLTHRNLLTNLAMAEAVFSMGPSKMVLWAPMYHGTGLIGAILVPILFRAPVILLPPTAVMEKPIRWLRAISRYKATSSGGPNFIFQFAVDRTTPAEREGLDLSSWTSASCAAEPIRMSTLDKFAETYAPYGFRRESFATGYGLSESSLVGTNAQKLTMHTWDRTALTRNEVVLVPDGDPGGVALVSSGRPFPTLKMKIVDPETCLECPPDRVGEIWMSGPTVAAGYWNKPQQTAETFHAKLADSGDGPYLRTGDLGFFYEGELYIGGRLKETIIVHGRNYYAQDIETAVASSHPALQPAAAAAFSVPVGAEERIVLFQELKPDQSDADVNVVAQAIRRAAAESLQLSLYAVVLVKAGTLPRTGLGKIQRYLVRSQFLESQRSEQLV